MKWIGQHIWDYISRFRNDVYLEDISTGTIASGGNLGLDSNNKIVKADTEAGELSFNGSTANGLLTYGNASTIDVESTLTYNGGTGIMLLESSISTTPQIFISNTNTDATSGKLVFQKSAAGSDNDDVGVVAFNSQDDGGNVQSFAQIVGEIADASDNDEAGKVRIGILTDGSALQDAFIATGLGTGERVDINLGHGNTSTTTIAGNLETNGKITIKNGDYLYFNNADNSYQTRLNATTAAGNKTIVLPNESGTVQLQGSSTGQTFNVSLKVDDLYILYVTTVNTWFHTGYVGQSLGTSIGDENDSTAMRAVSYVAPSACKVNKVTIAFYMTGSADLEFQVTKIPLVDGSNSNVTLAAMTHNDINFSASANYNYVKTMTMTGAGSDNELSAGQAFTLAVRQTGGSYTRVLYGNCFAEIELT